MDGRAFDNLTRDVARPRSRRGLLAGFGGGTLASVLGGAGLHALKPDDAAAKKKKKKKKKKKGCTSANCNSGRICVEGTCITGDGSCESGASTCGATPFAGTCNDNPDCFCFRTITDATRCAKQAGTCGNCTTHEDCAGLGLGAKCATASDVASCPCDAGQNFCITPCPA